MNFVFVFVGGGLGSICRYGISQLLKKQNFQFPFATLIANVLACILLGYLIAHFSKGQMSETQKLLLMTGFCGGFSTFSTFSGETFQLFGDGHMLYAFLNIVLSVAVCLFAIMIGHQLGK